MAISQETAKLKGKNWGELQMSGEGGGIPGGLTVVMPLFNKGTHVARAIESVLAQIGGFDVLVIVDDASTDDGMDRVREFSDSRIEVLHRHVPGPGGYAARNMAIRHANTEWIAFLDADDAWEPTFTLALRELISRFGGSIGCAFTSYRIVDPNGESRLQPFGEDLEGPNARVLELADFLDAWLHYRDSPIWTGAVAFRRDILLRAGLFPEGRCRRGGDKDLWLRALMLAPAAFDPRPHAVYFRDSSNMVTRTVSIDSEHCLVSTIASALPSASAEIERRLKKLSNLETYRYSLVAARSKLINYRIYRRYYNRRLSIRYYILLTLCALPKFMRPHAGKICQRLTI